MVTKIARRSVLLGGAAIASLAAIYGRSHSWGGVYKPAVLGRAVPGKSSFDEFSTAEQVTEGIDLSGKTALVTGCNSGFEVRM